MRGMKSFGTQPAPQNFADGGAVGRIKGMLGFKPAEYRAELDRSKQAALSGYKDGGMVRGPGTSTSDEVHDEVPEGTYIMPADSTQAVGAQKLHGLGAKNIPVNLSNGEFKMPPEQVHAVGVQALDQMKAATHTPAAAQARGMKPDLFFADGGVVDEEQKRQAAQRPNFFPGNSPDAGVNIYAGVGPANGSGSSRKLTSGAENVIGAQQPKPPMATPVQQAIAQPGSAPASGLSYADNNQAVGQQIKDNWNKGNYGEAVGQTIAGTTGMFTTPLIDSAVRGSAAAWEGAKGFGRGMFGISQEAAPSMVAAASVPVAPAASQVAPGAFPSPVQAADAKTPVVPGAAPSQGEQAPAAQAQVMPGVYQHGRGQYSDQASGMNFSAGFTGQPNAQNMAAADALVARSEQNFRNQMAREQNAAAMRPGGGPVAPGSFTGGWSGVIGTDPAAGRERKAMVDAMMTPLRGAQNGQLTASQRQGMAGLLDAERRDASGNRQADQTVATQRDIAAMREQGDTGRALLRETGESGRAGARNQLDARRIGLEERGQAPKLREAERMDALYTRYESANPDDRKAIVQQIRELQGKTDQGEDWAHSPGGQIVDPKTQQLITQPGVLYNRRTGELRGGSSAAKPPPISENPAVQQIMNNTALSREERAKQIRALGYK